MKNHLVNDNNINTLYLLCPIKKIKRNDESNIRLAFSVGDTARAVYNTVDED